MVKPNTALDHLEGPARGDSGLGAAPTAGELFWSFLRLGSVSFGGPAMVAYIGAMVVKQKRWMKDDQFKTGVALFQTVPGAIAMQTAAYVMVVLIEPRFGRLQTSRLFRGMARGASVSFVGLLVAVAVQFTRATHWTGPGAALTAAGLAALLLKVDVLWGVLGGAAISALLL